MVAQLFDQPTIVRLQVVIETIRSGNLLLPDFQRPFVWKDDQRLRLFDSIVKGLPIGSLMIWRTAQKVAIKSEIDGIALPPPAKEAMRSYLLDGQQRMFTLYAALGGALAAESEGTRRRWPIYLDLELDQKAGDKKEGESRFRLARRDGKVPLTWFPLSSALLNKRVVNFQQALWASKTEEHDRLADRAEEVANIIRDYPIALVPLVVEDLGLVTQSFQRVNSAGSPMSEVHMLRALTYDGIFDLDERFKQIVAGSAWLDIEHQILVNVIKAIAGISIYGTEMAAVTDVLKSHVGPQMLEQTERGILGAIAFLNDTLHIRGQEALPYAHQAVALAAAAADGADLHASSAALTHWFWATTFTEHFTGMTAGQLRTEFEHVRSICAGDEPLPLYPQTCALSTRFQATSVRSLALMHLLADQDLIDVRGQRVDGPELLARGSAVFVQLLPGASSTDPANRLLVAPEQAIETRRALLTFGAANDALRAAHQFPPIASAIGSLPQLLLNARRDRLKALERAKIESLGLSARVED